MLLRYEPKMAARFRFALCDRDVPSGKVTGLYVADLVLLLRDYERAPQFLPRDRSVDMMHLIQFDVISLQAAQRAFKMAANLVRRQPSLAIRSVQLILHVGVYLGRQNRLLAAASIMRNASFSSVSTPKFIVPRHSRLTLKPERPNFAYSIDHPPPTNSHCTFFLLCCLIDRPYAKLIALILSKSIFGVRSSCNKPFISC